MKKKHASVDGFLSPGRRQTTQRRLGQVGANTLGAVSPLRTDAASQPVQQPGSRPLASASETVSTPLPRASVNKNDLDQSLSAIDTEAPKKEKVRKPRSKKRKIIKRVVLVLVILLVAGAGFAGWKLINSGSKVFQGNILEALAKPTPLASDTYGRTNILVYGTSEDDPNHGGADLADSIMVASLDQNKKVANLVSVPRDLWVNYTNSCDVGYAGKINAQYHCALADNDNDTDKASMEFADKVGSVLGIDIQYYAHVNYTVVKDVVDAVGGVDVNIQSTDPRGILDRNFDWQCNYKCYYVKYPNGPAHLDGVHALALSRARNAAGGYGLPRANFDREKNQQMILKAVQTKALSAGTLANPVAMLNVVSSLGDNIRTNFQTKELTTLIGLAKDINQSNIVTVDLYDEKAPLVKTGTGPDGSSIVEPTLGLEDYSGIQSTIKAVWSGDASVLEHAKVAVYNASGVAGAAQTEANKLTAAGFTVGTVASATDSQSTQFVIYDQTTTSTKPATLKKLESQLGVTATKGSAPGITNDADFVVVLGTGQAASPGTSSSSGN